MSKTFSIKLLDDLDKKLSEIARETKRSKSFLIQKALEVYLAEIVDFQVAMERLNDTSDPITTLDKIRMGFE